MQPKKQKHLFYNNFGGDKKAQPTADNNNPVCRLCFIKSTLVMFALKYEGWLTRGVNSYRFVDIL